LRINIYYGGRGNIEDPTIHVMNVIMQVLEELRVEVKRYNLHEDRNGILTLPKTLKDVDGVILASHVEWFGIGGYMQQFLDACWLYGDKNLISQLYMMPVVISSSYGERDAENTLCKAWELLGGIVVDGIHAHIKDTVAFETSSESLKKIEKKAEELYRAISKKQVGFPSSLTEVRERGLKTKTPKLTPQESEQLSEYVADDNYVKKQKKDIEELAFMFKGMMGETFNDDYNSILTSFETAYNSNVDFAASYLIKLEDIEKDIYIKVSNGKLQCTFGMNEKVDVFIRTKHAVLKDIMSGKLKFQNAFMSGVVTAKGNFNTLRMLDNIFKFG